jgi:hypothetical protein
MDRLDVETSRMQPVLVAILGVIFIPLAVMSMITGVSDGGSPVGVMLGLLMLATFGGVMWLVRRGHSRSVRYFSTEGLRRNDGTSLAWADLERVVHQVRVNPAMPGDKKLWRTEIWFRNGQSAWLLPMRVGNRRQVDGFVAALPCEHAEVRV